MYNIKHKNPVRRKYTSREALSFLKIFHLQRKKKVQHQKLKPVQKI